MRQIKSLASLRIGSSTADGPPGVRLQKQSSLDSFPISEKPRISSNNPQPTGAQREYTLLYPIMDQNGNQPSNENDVTLVQTSNVRLASQDHHQNQPLVQNNAAEPHGDRRKLGQGKTIERHKDGKKSLFSRNRDCKVRSSKSNKKGKEREYSERPRMNDEPQQQNLGSDVLTPNQEPGPFDGALFPTIQSTNPDHTVSSRVPQTSSNSSSSVEEHRFLEAFASYNDLARRVGLPQMERCPGEFVEQRETAPPRNFSRYVPRILHNSVSRFSLTSTHAKKTRKEEEKRKDIFQGKSLEETNRLGGVGSVKLPSDFGTNTFRLPTSLAAAFKYLYENGHNESGLFRTGGQSNTVNELYQFYAAQFLQAGTPSKVQQTVRQPALPDDLNLEYTVPDVASLFKKIISGLPGGLLGAMSLFEALRNSLVGLRPEAKVEVTGLDDAIIKPKLVALAIRSTCSEDRIHLIEAVLGLVACLSENNEKLRAVPQDEGGETSTRGLMTAGNFATVLGPVLLGALTDQIEIEFVGAELIFDKSSDDENTMHGNMPRLSASANADPRLAAGRELQLQAKKFEVAICIFRLLLTIWKDVVLQLREIQSAGGGDEKRSGVAAGGNITIVDESSNGQAPRALVNKKAAYPSSLMATSPSPHPSENKKGEQDRFSPPPSSILTMDASSHLSNSGELVDINAPRGVVQDEEMSESDTTTDELSKSTMDHMTMGTILQRPGQDPESPEQDNIGSPFSPSPTPSPTSIRRKPVPKSNITIQNVSPDFQDFLKAQQGSVNSPLPQMPHVQHTESRSSLSENIRDYSSPCSNRPSAPPADETVPPRPEDKFPKSRYGRPTFEIGKTFKAGVSRTDGYETIFPSESTGHSEDPDVEIEIKHAPTTPKAHQRHDARDEGRGGVFASMVNLPKRDPKTHKEASMGSPGSNTGKITSIPRPVQDVASSRKTTPSRSPSPTKETATKGLNAPPTPTIRSGSCLGGDTPPGLNLRQHSPQTIIKSTTVSRVSSANRDPSPTRTRTTSGNVMEIAPPRTSVSSRRAQFEMRRPITPQVSASSSRTLSSDIKYHDDHIRTSFSDAAQQNEIARLKQLLEKQMQEIESYKRMLEAVDTQGSTTSSILASVSNDGDMAASGVSVIKTSKEELRRLQEEKIRGLKIVERAEAGIKALTENDSEEWEGI